MWLVVRVVHTTQESLWLVIHKSFNFPWIYLNIYLRLLICWGWRSPRIACDLVYSAIKASCKLLSRTVTFHVCISMDECFLLQKVHPRLQEYWDMIGAPSQTSHICYWTSLLNDKLFRRFCIFTTRVKIHYDYFHIVVPKRWKKKKSYKFLWSAFDPM
jgi:hypothetical protein